MLRNSSRRGAVHLLLPLLVLAAIAAGFWIYKNGGGGYLAALLTGKTRVKPASAAQVAAANGMRVLANDEYFIDRFGGEEVKPWGIARLKFADGVERTLDMRKGEMISVIPPRTKGTTYVSTSKNSEIGSAAKDLDSALALQEKVTAIIEFNLPFDKYYEPGDSSGRRTEKKNKFNEAKGKVAAAMKGTKGKVKKDLKIVSGVSADLDKKAVDKLRKDPAVKRISLDGKIQAVLDQSLNEINAKEVWPLVGASGAFLDGSGIRIAIIDTGVDYTHPDLGGCLGTNCKVVGGYDFVNGDSDPMDDHGHGTHVAATAAGIGFLNGVAPGAKILAYKVLDAGGYGDFSDVIAGIDYATDPNHDGNSADHVEIGSMSLGANCSWYGGYSQNCGPGDPVSVAVDKSSAAGVVWTIAAGNSGSGSYAIGSPGTARSAITVAAACKSIATPGVTNDSYCGNGQLMPYFSSRGPVNWNGEDLHKPDVAAPGVYICAARWGNAFEGYPECGEQHIRISGTSMATPHVAGAAALIKQAYPSYTPEQVKQLLKSTARNLGSSLTYNDQGAGEINLKAALPNTSGVSASPSYWQVKSDPTKKLSAFEQAFTVTKTANLEIGSTFKVPGITLAFSPKGLSGPRGTTFKATLTIDNDLAKAGTYSGHITFYEKGKPPAGGIYVLVKVLPTMEIAPVELDYGVDPPNLTTWTSAAVPISLKNLRADVPQTVSLALSGFPIGVTFNAPATITVPPGSTTNIESRLSVENPQLTNGTYNGTLTIKEKGFSVTAKFLKFYVLTLSDPDPSKIWWAEIHDRKFTTYVLYPWSDGTTLYLNEPGPYDVIVRYGDVYDSALKQRYLPWVFKENVNLESGKANVIIAQSDAKHTLTTLALDESGNQMNIPVSYETAVYKPNPWFMFNSLYGLDPYLEKGWSMHVNKISDVSSNYSIYLMKGSYEPSLITYKWNHFLSGASGGMTIDRGMDLTGELRTITIKEDVNASSTRPFVWSCYLEPGCIEAEMTGLKIDQPSIQKLQVVESGTGRKPFYQVETHARFSGYDNWNCWPTCNFRFLSSYFSVDGTSDSPATTRRWDYYGSQILPQHSSTLFVGRGPFYPNIIFSPNSTALLLRNYWQPVWKIPIFLLSQDYSVSHYEAIPFELISAGGNLIKSGEIPSFNDGGNYFGGEYPIGLPGSGSYTLNARFPYYVRGQKLTGTMQLKFSTASQPPSFTRLNYFSRGVQSEVYDPIGPNKLEFEIDPFKTSVSSVTVRMAPISSDIVIWQKLEVTKNGNIYTAVLPNGLSVRSVVLQINITNTLGDSLTYTFPVQSGEVYDPAPIRSPLHCDYLVPEGCTLIPGPNYDPTTQCGQEVVCPSPPVVTSTSPTSGSLGAEITLTGSQFTSDSKVNLIDYVGAKTITSITPSYVDMNKIVFTLSLPSRIDRTVGISVVNKNGSSKTSSATDFYIRPFTYITKPAGGENLTAGQQYTVSWGTSSGPPMDSSNLFLYQNQNGNYINLYPISSENIIRIIEDGNWPSMFSYNWTVPALSGSGFSVSMGGVGYYPVRSNSFNINSTSTATSTSG